MVNQAQAKLGMWGFHPGAYPSIIQFQQRGELRNYRKPIKKEYVRYPERSGLQNCTGERNVSAWSRLRSLTRTAGNSPQGRL